MLIYQTAFNEAIMNCTVCRFALKAKHKGPESLIRVESASGNNHSEREFTAINIERSTKATSKQCLG